MNIGRLNKRVRIERKTDPATRSASGALVVEWTAVATVWASIAPLRGREYLGRSGELAEGEAVITFRAMTFDIDPGVHRFVYVTRGTIYNVVHVADVDERHRQIQVVVKSGTNDGR